MADNVAITPGVGATIGTDDVSGVQIQRVKVGYGSDGAFTDVSGASPLPSKLYVVGADSNTYSVESTNNDGSVDIYPAYGLNTASDNVVATQASPYPAEGLFTSSGSQSSASFLFDLGIGGASPSMAALGSLELAFELAGLGQNITAITVQPRDTVGVTTLVGPTYNLYNVVPADINTLPTMLITNGTTGRVYLPIFGRGGFKTLAVVVTFGGVTTNAGTCKCRAKLNPYMLPVMPEYIVQGYLTGQGAVTNAALFQAPGTNNRLHFWSALITNDSVAAGTAKIVNNDTAKVPFTAGRVAAPGGWQTPFYGPLGIPATAQNQAVNLTTTGVSALDCFATFRIGV